MAGSNTINCLQDISPENVVSNQQQQEHTSSMHTDVVEDFARQLDEICASTVDMNTSDDEGIPFGYQQLPQNDDEDNDMDDDMDNDLDDNEHEYEHHPYHIMDDNSTSNGDISGHQEIRPLTLTLDPTESISKETSSAIMDIMKKIEMPEHAVPEWAKTIPESSWMPQLKE